MPVSGTGQGHSLRPSLSSPWSLPLLPPRSLCVGTCRAGKENVSSSKFLGCISSQAEQQSSVTPDVSLGMGGAHVQTERLRVAQCLGRAGVLPTSHPSIPDKDTYSRSGTGTRSGHDRVLFYWEEMSAQEVRCGRCWRGEGDGVQSETGTWACGPRTVEWGFSTDSKQQEACGCTCWLTDCHP